MPAIFISDIVLDEFRESTDAFGCCGADDSYAGRNFCGVGVDIVDGDAFADVVKEGGRGVNYKTGANDDEYVGGAHDLGGRFEIGYGFLKENDMGTDMVAVDNGFGSGDALFGTESVDFSVIVDGANLHQFAVEMKNR